MAARVANLHLHCNFSDPIITDAYMYEVAAAHVAVFEYKGDDQVPELTEEPIEFEALPLAARNYKT